MARPFYIGDWLVDPDSGRLSREGEEVKLEPRVMAVLVYLAQNPGKVVSRESLEASVWTGMVVGYDAVSASIIKLRKAFHDDSRRPRVIETISKKGYRLIAPVAESPHAPTESPAATNTPPRKSSFTSLQLAVPLVLLAAAILYWQLADFGENVQQTHERAAIVVLPFENLSQDPAQDYFSDGITDDLITDLSRVGSLRVIARESAYHYKQARQPILREVADELSVQYIVQGSVQKVDARIRINVRLTSVDNGEIIWAERFDTRPENLFDVQDKIIERVISALTLTVSGKMTKTLATNETTNFEAYDTFLLGQKFLSQRSKEGYDMAMNAFRHADSEIDPGFARVYGAMAVAITYGYRFQWTDLSLGEARERALEFASKAVALNQSSPQIYWALGYTHIHRKEYAEAEAAAKRSVALSPSYADGYGLLAYIANWRGEATAAETYIKKATALNPYHSFDYPWNLGLSYYHQGRYDEAVTALNDALVRNANALYPHLFLAASLVRLGRIDDAKWEVETIMVNRPDTTLTHLKNLMPFEHKEHLNAVLADLRSAGLPE